VSRNAWLKRSDAEIELGGWMTVWKKPAEALRIAGEIDARRGWYTFRGKRFTLAEGRVTFTGHDLDPLLDLTAAYRTRAYEVFVVVGGRLSKPTLRLESDPPLAESDVLSVLLFGKTAAELSGGETTALEEQTVAIASSYAAQGLSQSVASTLGLDTLEFDAGGGALEGSSVTAGKYLAEDVFVSLSHRFGAENVDELRVEYNLTKEWTLETSSDTLGHSGVDVFWKRRY
jgi:translocation and assembly module TamB